MSDDKLFETTSPLASFIVTLSANQDRVTATGTTTINVYDDDGEIIFSIIISIGLIDVIYIIMCRCCVGSTKHIIQLTRSNQRDWTDICDACGASWWSGQSITSVFHH